MFFLSNPPKKKPRSHKMGITIQVFEGIHSIYSHFKLPNTLTIKRLATAEEQQAEVIVYKIQSKMRMFTHSPKNSFLNTANHFCNLKGKIFNK